MERCVMKTSITTTTEPRAVAHGARLPGWMWFGLLWMGGVAGAVTLGYAFKLFMYATLFAVK
ncbi:hypothetical protein GNZ24_24590 [Burkholderia thailandensis]|nr:hypothetical protein A8H31_08820 [Burkholderia thailandensis]AWY62605.1 hypothetical protein A8H35_22720 [Burkholderia thailandensis]AWY66132.1 hypothetical protein A8H36_07865 [Burkholderia thailandensis]MUV24809.1 hypothetical protein [Burkholderia thailandensis]MUV30115.1 hypothetical protein [Burkholderia thailandensis]